MYRHAPSAQSLQIRFQLDIDQSMHVVIQIKARIILSAARRQILLLSRFFHA